MRAHEVHDVIASCDRCSFIDKPPCIYKVYERFLPDNVRVLVVSESPPPGYKHSYIYNLDYNDRLRRVLAKTFHVPEGKLIEYLMKNNIFWTTAVKCRPLSKKHIEYMRRNCLDILSFEINILKPEKITALGRTAWRSIDELRIKDISVRKYYHPLYLARFMGDGLEVLKSFIINS